MTESSSTLMALIFGLAVFAVIVAVGWRSVQNRRILRMKDADGQETIVIASEDDVITSVATTDGDDPAHNDPVDASGDASVVSQDRLDRVVASTK